MSAKERLKQKFSAEPDKYYRVKLFDEFGFERKKCATCGSFFWTLQDREICPNPPCQSYEFIGRPLAKKLDYTKTWKAIERFFVKNGHESVQSYPVVCRWFPGLYFTIASIVAFQRLLNGKTVFEMPANPLVIPQSCMRFNDIPNVGVTGRHLTNFVMIGQHSIYDERKKEGYWKDRCVDLDFNLLRKVFGIKPEGIHFLEDVWVGPNAFGYSLEYYVRGLELGNAVFTEFVGTPDNYKQMDQKIIDMGAGLERFCWMTQGTPTCYDAIYGKIAKKLLKQVDYNKKFWAKYAILAGNMNMEEFSNYRLAKEKMAQKMHLSTDSLIKITAPTEAIYAILDHSKSLLFAVADGGLPSNVGGGYNLRVILRRALGFINEFNFDIDLFELCEMHAKNLRAFNPRLKGGLESLEKILRVEEERYKTTRKRGEQILSGMIKNGEAFSTEKLIQLYESNGITPEVVEKIAEKGKLKIDIPTDFYHIISDRHMKEKSDEETKLNLDGLLATRLLFYEDQGKKEFHARVLRIIDGKYVVLDQTAFYGRAGGQVGDTGHINKCRVYDTEKHGNIIVHITENPDFKEGDIVHGTIDLERRMQIMKHHTSVHVIHGAAHKILGNHVWQAGAHKTEEKAHLDITHYKALTDDEVERIENLANKIVKGRGKIKKYVLPRADAEKLHGFVLYQGGAIPHKDLRIIEIPGFDVEACSGTHCDNTKQMAPIVITSSERIQDGVVRINIAAGGAAEKYLKEQHELVERVGKILETPERNVISESSRLFEIWKKLRKELENETQKRSRSAIETLKNKFVNNTLIAEVQDADIKKLQAISKELSSDERVIILFGLSDKIYIFGSAGNKTGVDVCALVSNVCSELGGKGGGTRFLAQGIGFNREKIENVIKGLEKELL